MKYRIVFTSLFLVFSSTVFSQESPYFVASKAFESNGYNSAINKLTDNAAFYESGSDKSTYYQLLSTYYSFVSEDSLAANYFEKVFARPRKPGSDTNQISLEGYVAENALDYVLKNIEEHRVVMINEAHYMPQHRVLIKELLIELRSKGFTYYASEGVNPMDSTLAERGYPLQGTTSGFYTNEPAFGNLIRTAIDLNYKVVGYDDTPICDYDSEKPSYCNNLRELYQAIHIKKLLEEDPTTKVIVHCGYDHLQEKTNRDWIKMAEYFNHLTGIDPYTINQKDYIERSVQEYESSFYQAAVELPNTDQPFVLTSNGVSWISEKRQGYYDVEVIGSRITTKNGRSSYLFHQTGFKPYLLDSKKLAKGYLVQALKVGEEEKAVPVDQFIVHEIGKEQYALILPVGEFLIKVLDRDDKVVEDFKIEIK